MKLGATSLAALLSALSLSCSGSNDVTRAPTAGAAHADRALAPPPLESGRLPDTARPLRYALSLVVDPSRDRFSGDVTITVEIPRPTRTLVLHGRELGILRAEVRAGGQTVKASAEARRSAGGKDTPQELVLSLARPVGPGRAEIVLAYSAALGEKLSGLYRVRDGGDAYAFTQFEPMDARRAFPCFDEPGFKVPFDLKITTPRGNLVVANTPEVERVASPDGSQTTFTFATTPPLPTYLIAFAVGPLEVREAPTSTVPIRLITTKGKSKDGDLALEAASAHVKILADYFDRPYPYAKLDLCAVPDFSAGAMENAGLITFREDLLLLDAKSASAGARRAMAEVVAHEIAHHWFGNLVTMNWWDDLWLNEGFATWMEAKVVDTWRPSMDARLSALGAKGWVMGTDAMASARAVRQPVISTSDAEEAFDGITYVKGGAVLGMIESFLGPTAFRDGVRAYVKSHAHGSAGASDLFRALETGSGTDAWSIASTFLDRPGVPLVRAELTCDKTNGPRVKLTQDRYRTRRSPSGDATWKIPVCVVHEGGPTAGSCAILEETPVDLPLSAKKCPRWIYPNAEERGYYRFALPPAGMAALGAAGSALPVGARIGLLADAWALVESGDLGGDALIDLLADMQNERSRLVIDQLTAVLRKVKDTLVDEASAEAFRAYASALLLPLAKELGWEARKGDTDDTRLLRRTALSALDALSDDPWLAQEAGRRAAAYLADPRSLDGDLASIALAASTRRAGPARLDELTRALEKSPAAEQRSVLVSALGSFSDPATLERALDLLLGDRLRLQDTYGVLEAANARPESRAVLVRWIRRHVEDLRKKLPSQMLSGLTVVAGAACDETSRAEAKSTLGAALKDVEGADRRLAEALEASDMCIELRAREGERARRRLKKR